MHSNRETAMSGEVIVAIAGGVAVAGIGVIGATAYGAGKVIKGLIDARVDAAVREMEAERARIVEWQVFLAEQHKQHNKLQLQQEQLRELEKRVASLTLAQPVAIPAGSGPTGEGYVSVTKDTGQPSAELIRPMLQQLGELLATCPDDFALAIDSPLPRLQQHHDALVRRLDSRKVPLPEELTAFKETIERTVRQFLEHQRLIADQADSMAKRLDKLLREIMTTTGLTDEQPVRSSLQTLKEQVLRLLSSTPPMHSQVEKFEQQLTEIKTAVETRLVNGAFRTTLAQSLARNLHDLGYVTVKDFPDDPHQITLRTELKIPGGERLRVTIDRTNKLAFKVLHETGDLKRLLSKEDERFFRDQEQRWCSDLKELIRRMVKEGFDYAIDHEQLTQIAVVVDPNEIDSQQDPAEVAMIRRRMQEAAQARARRMP
jgi:hypothetical protein